MNKTTVQPHHLKHQDLAIVWLYRPKVWMGMTIGLLGIWILGTQVWQHLAENTAVSRATAAGMMAALATALGTLPVALSQGMSQRTQDTLYGFGAGVMLAACLFSLILPGLEAANNSAALGSNPWTGAGIIALAMALGAVTMLLTERLLPHEHFIKGREGIAADAARKLQRTWLFVFAISLHNLPEGLAIGVSMVGNDGLGAGALATGIAIQDVPEGLVIALALVGAGYRRAFAVALGILSGLIEPLGAFVGATIVNMTSTALPWGLGFSAGAMLFVISHEIIPESHRQGHETFATGGLMIGFVLMMFMDTALG